MLPAAQAAAEFMGRVPPGEFVVRIRVPWIEVEARAPLPINLDGSESPRSQSTRAFAQNLKDMGLPILLQDERWSTVAVTRTRLQLSQKLWLSGVMKPSRPPVSSTFTYRAGPPVV